MGYCPKCNHEQKEGTTECENCGIVFNRYDAWLNARGAAKSPPSGTEAPPVRFSPGNLLFYVKADESLFVFYGRLVLLIGIVFWGGRFITSPIEGNYAGESWMHLVNLPFHEAGHILFRPFGPFIASLGGTMGQFLMPLICFWVLLLKTRDTFGACVTLWWFGQNFFDIAPYIDDARSLTLPLVGGNTGRSSPYGFHDWEYLLTESGLLAHDHLIAKFSVALGTIIFVLSFAWGGILLYKQAMNRV
jgi:hypothetical protein